MRYDNKTIEQLVDILKKHTDGSRASILESCKVLAEMSLRQHYDPLMRCGFYRHYEKIANGALGLTAAIALGGYDVGLKAIAGLPAAEQDRLANGGTVKVAVHTENGEMRIEERRLLELTRAETNMALSEDGYRAPADQKKILAKRNPVVHRSPSMVNIRVDLDNEEIVIGRVRIPVAELTAPLKELGFKLTRRKKLTASRTVSLDKAA